jgi:hypothetical protein
MAKTQSMSLNPTKISGSCGRLMCCLRYEQDAYEDLVKTIPKNGAFVQTTGGYGNVIASNVLRQKIKVRMDGGDEQDIRVFDAAQVAAISGGRPKPGEPLPDILRYVPPVDAAPELKDDPWKAPSLFADNDTTPEAEEAPTPQKHEAQHQRNRNRKKQQPPKKAENSAESKAAPTDGQTPAPKKSNRNRRYRPGKPKGGGPQGN